MVITAMTLAQLLALKLPIEEELPAPTTVAKGVTVRADPVSQTMLPCSRPLAAELFKVTW